MTRCLDKAGISLTVFPILFPAFISSSTNCLISQKQRFSHAFLILNSGHSLALPKNQKPLNTSGTAIYIQRILSCFRNGSRQSGIFLAKSHPLEPWLPLPHRKTDDAGNYNTQSNYWACNDQCARIHECKLSHCNADTYRLLTVWRLMYLRAA